jgi:rubrerythrin
VYQDPGYGNYTLNNQRYVGLQPKAIVYTEDPYDIYSNLPEALRLIENALTGETEDRLFYQYLISVAPDAKDKQIIAGIRDDEIKHYRMFEQIYYEITGNMLNPGTSEKPKALLGDNTGEKSKAPSGEESAAFERPASYCAGLQKALMGEQAAVTRYRKILFAMRLRRHINMMTEIITDELRHLGLYNYLYAKNKCTD